VKDNNSLGDGFVSLAANEAKQRYNADHYTQVKVSVNPDVASAFKSACTAANVSMAGKLSQFMADYGNTVVNRRPLSDYSTRRQRRTAVCSLIQQLEQIKAAEERCRDNTPENLQGSMVFESADQCVTLLDEAIDLLGSIY